jgi:tRNA A37 threonylcarbamoyladenosine dehydratase
MGDQFDRPRALRGAEARERLFAARVAVFGLGGVGSAAAEALARAGVGTLTLVDSDTVDLTNLNRQIVALHSNLGLPKAEAMAQRVRDINPACTVLPLVARYCAETRDELLAPGCDYIIDAIDSVTDKLDLILTARERKIPILSAMGTGNRLDPEQLRITDLSETSGCPLARVMRHELRRRGILHLKVLYSSEPPIRCGASPSCADGRRSVPGSSSWVPACAGLMMAGKRCLTWSGQILIYKNNRPAVLRPGGCLFVNFWDVLIPLQHDLAEVHGRGEVQLLLNGKIAVLSPLQHIVFARLQRLELKVAEEVRLGALRRAALCFGQGDLHAAAGSPILSESTASPATKASAGRYISRAASSRMRG